MSKFRGVYSHKDGGFVSSIGIDGESKYLGWFRSFDEAKQARLTAEVEFFGCVFDRREIEVFDGFAKIPLHGRGGKFYGWTIVDIDDLSAVRGIAWTLNAKGYVVGRPSGFDYPVLLHRFILVNGEKGGPQIDHVNGDILNNRRANLRTCSNAENAKNTRISRNNSSGAKGVTQTPNGRWRARIWNNWKEIHIGTFDSMEEARAAYDRAAIKLHGEFASPNVKLGA